MATTRIPRFSGSRLRAARTAREWARGRLAVAVGVTVTSVASWERGVRSPTPAMLKRLAGVLGVVPGDLLDLPQSEWGQNEWRVTNGLEQREVAAALGVSPTTLSAVEATYSPFPTGMPERLATLYGTTSAEIESAWERDRRRLTTTG